MQRTNRFLNLHNRECFDISFALFSFCGALDSVWLTVSKRQPICSGVNYVWIARDAYEASISFSVSRLALECWCQN